MHDVTMCNATVTMCNVTAYISSCKPRSTAATYVGMVMWDGVGY